MSASLPPLLGPIDTGSSFMIVSLQNNIPFVLNGFLPSGRTNISYYWESNLNVINSSATLGIFVAQGTVDSVTIRDSTNGGGIAFETDGVTIVNAITPANMKISQPFYANWFPPDIFISAVQYTMQNVTSGATAFIHTNTSATGTTIPANNIVFLPILWYFNCTNSGTYDLINQPLSSVVNWFCLADPKISGCDQISLAPGGWTNLSDCNVGNKYTYCAVNNICGNNNCKGPCSVIYDDCNFNQSNYVCVFDADKFFADTQWWESPYFIGAVVGIIVIIIIILIIIFAVARR